MGGGGGALKQIFHNVKRYVLYVTLFLSHNNFKIMLNGTIKVIFKEKIVRMSV